jgi:hypothetical protein
MTDFDIDNLPFEKWKIVQEVKIRGRYVCACAELEFLLAKIIIYCDTNNPTVTRKFNRIKLDNKIKWAQRDLKKHHPQIFRRVNPFLDKIYKLKKIRNNIAHNSIEFDIKELDKSFISVREFVYKDNENKMEITKYTMDELDKYLFEFKAVTIELIKTWMVLVKDYSFKNPSFSASFH